MKKIVIIGASGDLAKRKIMPALSRVVKNDTKVYAYARSDLENVYASKLKSFIVEEKEADSASTGITQNLPSFADRVKYIRGEYSDLSPLRSIIDKDTVIYFSIPPLVYPTILRELSKFDYSSISIEKPFGTDLESFKELQKYQSDKVRFIDHYLLKPMMISLYEIYIENMSIFNNLNSTTVKSVECFFIESIGAEGRDYFDQSGMIKDVMQNHLIEMVASILCDKKGKDFSKERLDFIKDMEIDKESYVFGQYNSYCKEMAKESKTETFAAFKCEMKNEKWAKVPFLMAAGKGLKKKKSEIVFNIRPEAILSMKLFESNNEEASNEPVEIEEIKNKPVEIEEIKTKLDAIKDIQSKFNAIEQIRNEPVESLRLVFNIESDNEIYISYKINGKIHKITLVSSELINSLKEVSGAYESVFDSLVAETFLPTISFTEAAELWRLFNEIDTVEKPLVYYESGIEMPEEALELFNKNR